MSFKGVNAGTKTGDLITMLGTSALDTIVAALTTPVSGDDGIFVKVDTSANNTITIAANTDFVEGQVISAVPHDYETYLYTVHFLGYYDYEGNWHSGIPGIKKLYYGDQSVALGQEVQAVIAGSVYNKVKGVNSGGNGKIICIDDPEDYVSIFY